MSVKMDKNQVTYQQMALYYDQLMKDAPYDSWRQFTEDIISCSQENIKSIVDLGCGTGRITTQLSKNGYQMTGIDFSSEMLSYARNHADEENLSIQWLQQDLRSLKGLYEMDAAISYCDVINYITDEADLRAVFQNVAALLRDGGLFFFDVHSINQVQNHFINHTFADVDDDVSYIWFCSEGDQPGEMFHDLTFFVADNGKYSRFDEFHHQRTFSVDFYKNQLDECGFDIYFLSGDFNSRSQDINEDTERIFFVAKKRSEN